MLPSSKADLSAAKSSGKAHDVQSLDLLTGGAFTAATSGERTSRIREWLAGHPDAEQMQEVYRELANRDKGAAKALKEKLDEIKRAKGQEAVASEWAAKAEALLALSKLNLADALAWQRDAAKAGAPLSREPLASLKMQLADRVKTIEDLQHRAQVQREAAVLIAQRTEVLSTKPWREAEAVAQTLRADVQHWQQQAADLTQHPVWPSVDPKFPPLLDASRAQLLAVSEAFQGALALAITAAADPAAPMPAVPVWADELRAAHGLAAEPGAADKPARAPKFKQDPAVLAARRADAQAAVQAALSKLEQDVAEGHGKTTPKSAADLRNALKAHVRHIDAALEAAAHAALTAAGELEGWQRWRADQIRDELIEKAEALVAKPLGGRKQQEALRAMREQWKTSDQGGTPNHALWKRFDEACNEAHKVVEAWLEKTREQADAVKAQRRVLIDEITAWTEANKGNTDWKHHIRSLNGFVARWREAGHLSEKAFAEIQPLWKAAMDAADAPLTAARQESLARRRAMIEEAQALGAESQLRIDSVKALQQRWQHEAQQVPIERKQEQKLWDAFRKPIDDAFQRKSAEREKAASAVSEYDRMVLEASKAVAAATAEGDVQKIHAAAKALEAIVRGQVPVPAPVAAPVASAPAPAAAPADSASAAGTSEDSNEAEAAEPAAPVEAAAPPKPAPKPVVAMRGDDRPGMRKPEAAPAGRPGKFGDRKDARPGGKGDARGPRTGMENKFEPRRDDRDDRDDRAGRGDRFADRAAPQERGPRLSDAAFRAQREAFEAANQTLKKLAAQAHGEVLTQLVTAWEQRDAAQLPAAQDLGKAVPPAVRTKWTQAVSQPASANTAEAAEALLRLEIATELPTPAEQLSARRMLQLQLLTRRNAASPQETWGEDVARVLSSSFDAGQTRRLQNILKALLKR